MVRNNAICMRIRLTGFFFTVAFVFLACHLYKIQIARHGEFYAKAKSTYTSVKTAKGKRGEIYDCEGNLLVGNIPCFDICADPQLTGGAEQSAEIADYFSEIIPETDRDVLYRRLMKKDRTVRQDGRTIIKKNRYAPIASKVGLDKVAGIKKYIKRKGFQGIAFPETSKRYYPKNELLANILGFTNIDRDRVIAVIGVERFFNDFMSSSKSRIKYERARDGLPLSYGWRKEAVEAKNGMNLYLTIKEPVQAILEEELDKLMVEWKPRTAYAVMADPYTGNILAIAQRPTFNPNDRERMSPDAWRNRITEDVFEPGSTMKPVAVAGALDYGKVKPDTVFDCESGIWYYAGQPLRDSHPMKKLSVAEIVQKSSNIGTAKIALELGERKLYNTLRRFGFGEKTGIPLKPETSGIFRPLKRWDSLSVTRFPIGQGIAVSPLQLVRAYCALANGGKLVKLRLIDRLENPSTGKIIKNPVKPAMNVFFHSETSVQIRKMMKMVTKQGGTARNAALDGYEVAGKTGTSQKVVNGVYSHSRFFASFIGFVPAERPAFVLLITADEPQGAHYGGTVAAPCFREISRRTLKYLDIKPDAMNRVATR
jgi:cell division protein FtsI/penicillin-binding protein 2